MNLRFIAVKRKKRGDLPTLYHSTQAAFSPNDKLIVTGTSRTHKNDGPGKLVFMHRDSLEIAREVDIGMRSVVTCLWHHRIVFQKCILLNFLTGFHNTFIQSKKGI